MPTQRIPESHAQAMALLRSLGASARLCRHAELVGESADQLLQGLEETGISVDDQLVRIGAALHDAGKILHPHELDGPGNAHEQDGERLLIRRGASADVARICRSHG